MTAVAATSVDPLAPATLGANATTLLQRDRWSPEQLVDYQRERLRGLIRHAVEHSPYYRTALGPGAERTELSDLPTLPKRVLMEQFDRIVTDRRLRLADLEPFLARADAAARIESAWTTPVEGYFSTEVLVIASGSLDHVGLHVCEEAIVEVVDEVNRPVPAGTPGSRSCSRTARSAPSR